MTDMQGIFFHAFESAYIPTILDEIHTKRIYAPFLEGRSNLIICDFGANIGLATRYFAPFASKVIAVEPSSEHRKCLNKMLAFNRIGNVDVYPYAIASVNGTTDLYLNGNTTAYSILGGDSADTPTERVEMATVERVLQEAGVDRVDFMKLDIEGEEAGVVYSDGFRNVAARIDTIVGEWHTWSGVDPNAMADELRGMGFKVGWLPDVEASVFVATRSVELDET